MESWTPAAVLELVQGLWRLGLFAIGAALGSWFWYCACRYGWPWSRKSGDG